MYQIMGIYKEAWVPCGFQRAKHNHTIICMWKLRYWSQVKDEVNLVDLLNLSLFFKFNFEIYIFLCKV